MLRRLTWPDGEFAFADRFWSEDEASAMYEDLRAQLDWRQHSLRLFGREMPSPRLSAWHGDAGVQYAYSGARYAASPWTPALSRVRERVERAVGTGFNGVLANRYRDGADGMGWHSDDEPELGPEPVIVSASFGSPRRILLRHRASGRREALLLGPGSLLLMAGASQCAWRHSVPKTRAPVGERINLTFRALAATRPLAPIAQRHGDLGPRS